MEGTEGAGTAAPRRARLPYGRPLAIERLLGFLAARAIPGVEHVAGGRYARTVCPPSGAPIVLELDVDDAQACVMMRARGAEPGSIDGLVKACRRLFDLDADSAAIDAVLATDPVLSPLVRAAPGTRLPGAIDGFELAVRAIVGQQVSVAGARTTLGRIAEAFGEPLDQAVGPIVRCFPTATRLASAPAGSLGMPRVRAEAIVSLARSVAAGTLDLSGDAEPAPTLDALMSIRGIGPWTADYVAMRTFRDADAFPATDLGVRHGFAALGLPDDPSSIRDHAERWRPWRAYAVMHLWHAQR